MKATPDFGRLLACAAAAALMAGCVTGANGPGKPPREETKAPAVDTSYYAEEKAEGKIIVIGDSASHIDFLTRQEMTNTVTKVGAGPAGEAVVLQTNPAVPALEERLWKEFQKRNLYYAEETHDGQVFVLGSLRTHYNFLREKKLAASEAFDARGVKVVVEKDPASPHLANRLKAQYAAKHAEPEAAKP